MSIEIPEKRNVLGVGISVTDYERTVRSIVGAAQAQKPLTVTALAVHGVICGVQDRDHRWRLNRFDIVTPDGQPVRWVLNFLHKAGLKDRVYGPDLTLRICAAAAEKDLPVYFYGSKSDVLEKLVSSLQSRFPKLRIAGSKPSMFRRSTPAEQVAINEEIRQSGARLVFVGLGCPRQEVWAYENSPAIGLPLIAVGAAFDFHAGLLAQAPRALQDKGLEWAFRLFKEPRRLWRRYLLLNPLYVSLFLLQWTGLSSFQDRGREPVQSENYA